MRLHNLKCWPEPYEAIINNLKTFEFRKNDRDFSVGDFLRLKEYDPETGKYTTREAMERVTFLMDSGFGVPEGYCIMSIVDAGPSHHYPAKGLGEE